MKRTILFLFIVLSASAQVENVPLENDVYTFLKEMEVKKIIDGIDDDVPNLRRGEVIDFLKEIEAKKSDLSPTEVALLKKHQIEFYDEKIIDETTWQLFGKQPNFFNSPFSVFDDKTKLLYYYKDDGVNLFTEMIGHFNYGHRFEPTVNNAELYDIGFRFRGTLFDHLGYNLTFIKGGVSGSRGLARVVDPRLNYNFKFNENIENISNYDFAEGYLQYYTEPVEGMDLTFQIGREKMTFGYGYNKSLTISGDHPAMDFIKFNFKYGILNFTSIHASTVGDFSEEQDERYTKYFAMNRFKFSFKDVLDFGLGEVIVYSGRGLELAYLNPLLFYKFAEMSLQDRDNGLFFLDIQTKFIKNLEFQGTFFLDENLLGHLQHLTRFSNKTAYQLGAMYYEAFGINDLSLFLEYTRIRPYVYTHKSQTDNYTAYGQIVGHHIGPNSDEIFLKAAYNVNEWIRPSLSFSFIRKGENIYNENGELVRNVGGNVFYPHDQHKDSWDAVFLDGNRINSTQIILSTRVEPIRDIIFDISYTHFIQDYLTDNYSTTLGFAELLMTLEF